MGHLPFVSDGLNSYLPLIFLSWAIFQVSNLLKTHPIITDADLKSPSAQDALSAANCLASPSIETLQSLIFIAQHLMPNIGAIATLRTLAATVMHTARAVGLHKIDSPSSKKRREHIQVDWAELEVK
jgi:hypothetical protein